MAAAPALLGWMSALADPTRARALRLVERHELTVADLCAVLQLPQSTVSRHLKVLADEGWVAARPGGDEPPLPHDARRPRADGAPALEPAPRADRAAAIAAQDDQRLASILAERQTRSQAFFSSAAGPVGPAAPRDVRRALRPAGARRAARRGLGGGRPRLRHRAGRRRRSRRSSRRVIAVDRSRAMLQRRAAGGSATVDERRAAAGRARGAAHRRRARSTPP